MNPQTEAKPNVKPVSDAIEFRIECRKLTGLVLRQATRFNHSDSVNTGTGIAIVPARITATGDWRPLSGAERADGFGLAQLRGAGKDRRLWRGFIPLADVAEIMYGE